MKKILLIDGNSIAYRAFFAMPLLSNDQGIHTNATLGFAMMLTKMMEEEQPTHALVAFDAGKTTFRHEIFADYKGGRQKTPPELSEQFPYIHDVLKAFQVKTYELPQYEADDIIGTLATKAEAAGFTVKIISGDKDLTQLASDNVTVAITRKGITDVDLYTPAFVQDKWGITPEQVIDLKGLMGDPSDNIPGVPGVGEKTALKLLQQFGTVEAVLDNIADVSGAKLKEKLTDNAELARASKQLATIERHAPIEVTLEETQYEGWDLAAVKELYQQLKFKSLLSKLPQAEQEHEQMSELTYRVVTAKDDIVFTNNATIFVETVEENYHLADVLGIAIVADGQADYVPFAVVQQHEPLQAWLADETKPKRTYDAKRAIVALQWHGIALRGLVFDSLLAAYIADPAESHVDMYEIATNRGYYELQQDEVVYGKGAKRAIPDETVVAEHVIRKARAAAFLYEGMIEQLLHNEQLELFEQLELPLTVILAEMEATGVALDQARLQAMGRELNDRLVQIESDIYALAGETFNINSPKQLGVILFEKLGLPPLKKTKTGYSTSADVLEKLADDHEVIQHILNYRQLGKLQSTYVEGLLKVVHPKTAKVHTIFNQTLTQTGRLSSTDPNLQNIPIRLEEGRKIRQAFVPSEEGWVIFAADYSQIELRVLAHIADDEKLKAAFRDDKDVHTQTAMDVFHVGADEVTSLMRRHAKAVNFGIVYGISDYGLSQSLNISRKEAAEFIERYLTSYPGVKRYMDASIEQAKQDGYVTTLLQRRRYIPELASSNFNLRGFAERTAMNTPIQGSAADIIKQAMIHMAAALKREQLQSRLLLQVHDELIFEAPVAEIERLKQLVPEVMENAVTLSVPLKVDFHYGPTWYDAK